MLRWKNCARYMTCMIINIDKKKGENWYKIEGCTENHIISLLIYIIDIITSKEKIKQEQNWILYTILKNIYRIGTDSTMIIKVRGAHTWTEFYFMVLIFLYQERDYINDEWQINESH